MGNPIRESDVTQLVERVRVRLDVSRNQKGTRSEVRILPSGAQKRAGSKWSCARFILCYIQVNDMAYTIEREAPKGWYSRKIIVSGSNQTEAESRLSAWHCFGHRVGVKVFTWRPYGTWDDPTPRYVEDTPMPAKERGK